MSEGNIGVVLKKIRSDGLVMSRVPKNCRDEFIKFSEDEFADDRGMCFKYVWEIFKKTMNLEESHEIKLNYIIRMLEETHPHAEQKPEGIKMLDGKNRMKGGEK